MPERWKIDNFTLPDHFGSRLKPEYSWRHSERRQTFTRSCVCLPKMGPHPACGRSFLAGDFAHVCLCIPGEMFFCCICTRVVTYNALSARRAYRLRHISTEIDAHITGLTGTRLPFYRPWDGSSHKFTVPQHGRHFEVRWEYEQTRFSNMSARSVHLCEQKKWKPKHVVKTFDAPPKLQGIVGAMELRNWQEDITAILTYSPPKAATREQRSNLR